MSRGDNARLFQRRNVSRVYKHRPQLMALFPCAARPSCAESCRVVPSRAESCRALPSRTALQCLQSHSNPGLMNRRFTSALQNNSNRIPTRTQWFRFRNTSGDTTTTHYSQTSTLYLFRFRVSDIYYRKLFLSWFR